MKVVLINPLTPDLATSPSLGAVYVAGAIERAGYEVSIIDANSRRGGYSLKRLYKEVQELKPDVLGFSFCTEYIPLVYQQIQILKKLAGVTLAGGPHPTALPEEALRNGADVVVRGEGEDTIADFLKVWESSKNIEAVRGISFKRGGEHVHTPSRPPIENLDTIQPARHLIKYENYGRAQRLYENILTSRGCPCPCTFCSSLAMGRKKVRTRSAENVVNEILELDKKYNFKFIRISDDSFTWFRANTEEICKMLIGKKIRWSCVTRVDKVDEDLLSLMKEAGCFQITFGLESFIPQTLKKIRKGISADRAVTVAFAAKRMGMDTKINLIHGWPWETVKDADETMRCLKEVLKQGIRCNTKGMLIPYPGTEIYETYHREYGFTDWWLKDESWHRPWLETSGINSYSHDPIVKRNFFRYSPAIKKKHREIFELEELGYRGGRKISIGRKILYVVSRFLFSVNPALERITIQIITKIVHYLKQKAAASSRRRLSFV